MGDTKRRQRDAVYEAYVRELKQGSTRVVSFERLRAALDGCQVVVLGGYSGLDYEFPDLVEAEVRSLVERKGNGTAYVLGATEDGIGRAYRWIPAAASELGLTGIKTAGIVSRNAAQHGVAAQDLVVFVDTDVDDWEVTKDGRSLMVEIARSTGGEMVYFRGGQVSEAEIREALDLRVPVTLYTGEGLAPSAANLARKRQRDPQVVADGTAGFVAEPGPGLTVLEIDRTGRRVPGDPAERPPSGHEPSAVDDPSGS